MSWLYKLIPTIRTKRKKNIPEGLWKKCPKCESIMFQNELENNSMVCCKCNYHFYISATKRLELFFDKDKEIITIGEDIKPNDFLKFKDSMRYKDRLKKAVITSNASEALLAQVGYIFNLKVVACAFEFKFIGGSMGRVVGERFVKACQHAITHKLPLICFASSGGARMQESLISLLQMSKTAAILHKLDMEKLPFISVLLDPCMGGVSASLATLGDINIAEPEALIGFTGPRIVKDTIKKSLPKNFQSSESLLSNGHIDMIVHRHKMSKTISSLLKKMVYTKSCSY